MPQKSRIRTLPKERYHGIDLLSVNSINGAWEPAEGCPRLKYQTAQAELNERVADIGIEPIIEKLTPGS